MRLMTYEINHKHEEIKEKRIKNEKISKCQWRWWIFHIFSQFSCNILAILVAFLLILLFYMDNIVVGDGWVRFFFFGLK